MATPLDSILSGIQRKKASPTETVGKGGYAVHGGMVQELETDAQLAGVTKWKTFSEMLLNAAIVGAGVRYFLNLIGKVTWEVRPKDIDDPEAVRLAELVEDILHDMDTPLSRITRRSAMYRFWGFSVQEWTAKIREDGVIGLSDIEPRPQTTIEKWDIDEFGNILGIVQRAPQDMQERYLPRQKVVYVVDDSLSDSPEGLGLFRHMYPTAKRLKDYQKLEYIGFETDLRGIPMLRAPIAQLQELVRKKKITQTQMDDALDGMRNFIKNHLRGKESGILLDSTTYATIDDKQAPSSVPKWSAELMKGGQSSMPELKDAINREILELARLMGVEHLLLGADSKGSHALAQTKTASFFLIVDSTLHEIKSTYEVDIVEMLFRLNGWDMSLMPELIPESVQFRDIEQIASVLADLATAGLAPDDPAETEIRDLMGLSHKPEPTDEEIDAALSARVAPPVDPTKPEEKPEDDDDSKEVKDDGSKPGSRD